MRDKLRSAEAIERQGKVKSVPLIHLITFKYDVDWRILVNAPQVCAGFPLELRPSPCTFLSD